MSNYKRSGRGEFYYLKCRKCDKRFEIKKTMPFKKLEQHYPIDPFFKAGIIETICSECQKI